MHILKNNIYPYTSQTFYQYSFILDCSNTKTVFFVYYTKINFLYTLLYKLF